MKDEIKKDNAIQVYYEDENFVKQPSDQQKIIDLLSQILTELQKK